MVEMAALVTAALLAVKAKARQPENSANQAAHYMPVVAVAAAPTEQRQAAPAAAVPAEGQAMEQAQPEARIPAVVAAAST